VFSGTPSGLVLRDADVPSGYKVRYEKSLEPIDISELLTNDGRSSNTATFLLNEGLLSSYARSFKSESSSHKGIASIVMLFRDVGSARRMVPILASPARIAGYREVPVGEKIGDVASAYAGLVQYDDKIAGRVEDSVIYLYFSTANAVAYIGVSDEPDADNSEFIALLASEQLQLMHSFGGEQLKAK
jgi:hypothetical protein